MASLILVVVVMILLCSLLHVITLGRLILTFLYPEACVVVLVLMTSRGRDSRKMTLSTCYVSLMSCSSYSIVRVLDGSFRGE